jgi:hypothetical protein
MPRQGQGIQVDLPSYQREEPEEDEDAPPRPSAAETRDILAVVFGSISLFACVTNVMMGGPGLLLALPFSIAGLVLGLLSQGSKRRLGITLSAVALGLTLLEAGVLVALIMLL